MNSYFNTNSEQGETLQKSETQARTQEEKVFRFMADRQATGFTAHEIHNIFPQWPITSIRRAMTNLMNNGRLIKTSTQRKGEYQKLTYVYEVKKEYSQGILF